MRTRFSRLYARKANVHHYVKYVDRDVFREAAEALDEVIAEYERVRADVGP
ncbi:hypothetical protein BCR44DRAFT_1369591, partial [Catenaria anguillulae PL171]